jgi:hypothetical protein
MIKKESRSSEVKRNDEYTKAEEIIPQDDAFHSVMNAMDIEWWYFDAVFDNDYSAHIGVRVFHIGGRCGIVRSRIEVYKDAKVVVEAIQTNLFKDVLISRKVPHVQIDGKNSIKFLEERYKNTGEWVYSVSFQINDHAVDLSFTGLTKGWKMETPRNSWAVPLPKAKVHGTITIHNKVIPVSGVGYHDHNWDYSFFTTWLRNIGWYWGRIIGDSGTVIWAQTIANKEKKNMIVVVNREKKKLDGEKDFFTIPPNNISFSTNKYVLNHFRWIPTHFALEISYGVTSTEHDPVDIQISMSVDEIQHSRIFIAHYWRYHVKTSGTILMGSIKETLKDKIQIIEQLNFKAEGKKL